MKVIILFTLLSLAATVTAEAQQNPTSYTAEKLDNTAAFLNLKNSVGFWHLSGPRSYEANNKFSIFWNNGTYHRYLTILDDGKIGIGTDSPLTKFHVNGRGITLNRDHSQYGQFIDFRRYGILAWQIHAGINNDESFNIRNGSSSSKLTILQSGNVGIGTTSPDSQLAVNGNIHAKEVKVDLTGWPDYVFTGNHDLPTLEEVEKHIQEKGHLINIPSAMEVEENGIQLGEMNMKLLEKIEELTLYTLQQQKQINKYQKDMKLLSKKLESLEDQINNQKK